MVWDIGFANSNIFVNRAKCQTRKISLLEENAVSGVKKDQISELPGRNHSVEEKIDQAFQTAEERLLKAVDDYVEAGFAPASGVYRALIEQCSEHLVVFLKRIQTAGATTAVDEAIRTTVQIDSLLKKFSDGKMDELESGLKTAYENWEKEWVATQQDIQKDVELTLTADQLKSNSSDGKVTRRYKRKLRMFRFGRSKVKTNVPLRAIFDHYRQVSVKPEVHKTLGHFSSLGFQLTNSLRRVFNRQLKLLVISLDKTEENEQSEIVEQRLEKFDEIVQALISQSDDLTNQVRDALTKATKKALADASAMAVTPGASKLLRRREIKVNDTSLAILIQRLHSFPEVWKINQQAFHRQMQADLWFGRMALNVFRLARNSRLKVQSEFLHPVEENIQLLEKGLETLRRQSQKKKSNDPPEPIELNDQLYLSADGMINMLENTTDSVAQILPESFDLLKGEAEFTELAYTRKLPTEKIALSRIADYLIKTNFTENHRKELVKLSQQVKQLNNRIVNSANLIGYSMEMATEDNNQKAITEAIDKTESEIKEAKTTLDKLKSGFVQQLTADQNNTLTSLEINVVVTRADQLQQYVNKEPVEKPFNRWISKKMRGFGNIWRKLGLFIVRRRHDVVVARHQKKHEELINDGELIQNFVESLRVSPELDQQLPYYYKQLFSGKHLSNAAGVRIRKNEISQARKVVGRIHRGSGGALAITGDAMTGITFLTNYIATQVISGKTYRIAPPVGGGHTEAELFRAIMEPFGKKRGNVYSVLSSIEPGSVFIFHDLEQWWLKHPEGDEAIKALTHLIERFGRRFYFLLTCNSFSFRLISKIGSLENFLTSTIVIAPATLEEMREIIWLRHTTGGMNVEISGKRAEHLNGVQWDGVLKKFYKRSNGNIGLALHFWLRSIHSIKGDTIVIKETSLDSFPNISNSDWKVLIYQLFLHRTLSLTRMRMLFEDEDPQWLRQNLSALIRFGLVEETGRHSYTLNVMSRPYIERWFNELKLIS